MGTGLAAPDGKAPPGAEQLGIVGERQQIVEIDPAEDRSRPADQLAHGLGSAAVGQNGSKQTRIVIRERADLSGSGPMPGSCPALEYDRSGVAARIVHEASHQAVLRREPRLSRE